MEGREERNPSNSEGGDAPKRLHVADILDRGIFNRGKKSSGSRENADTRGSLRPSDRTSGSTNAPGLQEQAKERTLMLTEKYEKLLAARKAGITLAPDGTSSSTPSAGSSSAVSKPSVKATSSSSSASTVKRPTPGPRIHTLGDLDANDRISKGGLAEVETEGRRRSTAKSLSPPAGNTRRPKCLLRREVKEPIFPGKLILTITTTCAMVLVFVFQLFSNVVSFNGRCLGHVDYSIKIEGKPIFSPLGYVACERNLKTTAGQRAALGHAAADTGYPEEHVFTGLLGGSVASYDGPNFRMADHNGGMTANKVRLYGESFRAWTAMFLHGGFQHLIINMLMNVQLLYVIEPDWGFCRTLAVYLLSGYMGNLVHGSMAPCITAVGASGALFGLCGALIPYCIEHWDTLIAPKFLVLESLVFLCVELFIPIATTSTWAHLGGYFTGIVFVFATIKSLALFDRGTIFQRLALRALPNKLSEERKQKYRTQILKATQAEEMLRIQYEQKAKAKANAQKFKFLKRLFRIYPYGPYRTRLRDTITRVIFLCLGIALFVYFYMAMYVESFYTKINARTSPFFSKNCFCGYILDSHPHELINAHMSNLAGKFHCFQSKEIHDVYCDATQRTAIASLMARSLQ